MIQLSPEDQANIAGLLEHPGFQSLLKILRARDEELLSDLAHIGDTGDLVKAARFWQVFRHLIGILESEPQRIAAELESLKEQGQGYDEVLSPMEAWIHKSTPDLTRTAGQIIPPEALAFRPEESA